MLSSKANAALMRLKEIEEKYKIKRREEKWKHKEDSSISSISINSSENLSTEEKQTSKNIVKLKLDIKMPNARIEEPLEDSKTISGDKESKSGRISSKSLEDAEEINLDIAMPLGYKLRRKSTVEKQESSNSDVTTIQENSSIESVLDDSITSSKSSAKHVKKSQGQSLKISESSNHDKSDMHENTIKTNSKLRKEQVYYKSSDMSGRRFSKSATSSNNSSIARLSEKSNGNVSKSHSDTRERVSMKEAEAIRTSEIVSFTRRLNNSNYSGSIRDDNVTNESIATIEDGSEIISEFSQTEKNIVDKTESVVSGSDRKYPISENVSTYTSNNSEDSIIENSYANDTFENISSSTIRSESKRQGEKIIESEREIDDNARFGMSQVKIVSNERYRSYRNNAENDSDGQGVIELVASKVMDGASICEISLDRELSNRVKNSGRIDANPNDLVSRWLNSIKSDSLHSVKLKKSHKYQTVSSHESIENVAIIDKNTTSVSSTIINTAKSSISDNTMMTDANMARVQREFSRRKSPPEIRMPSAISNRHESARKTSDGKVSDGTEERAMIDAGGLSVTGDKGKIELPKSSLYSREEERKKDDNVFEKENSQQLISKCTTNINTSVLRKLHSDATNRTIKRYTSLKTTISENSSGNNDEEIQDATLRKVIVEKENETRHSRKKDETLNFNNSNHEHKARKSKREVKVIYSKPVKTCKCNESRKENKALRLDEKQIRRLRKRIVELRLQREQENVRKYLQECKRLKSELNSYPVQSYFSPLEFPKIAEFTHNDTDIKSQTHDHYVLRERISGIKQWLKNQYTLYRDYCVMAQAINTNYVPATLEDAKKTIRKMRKTVIKTS